MGVRRGAWEQVKRGGVWKPGQLNANIPAIGDPSGRHRARALEAQGAARAAGLGVLDGILRGVADIAVKMQGIQRAQEDEADAAVLRLNEYRTLVRRDEAKFDAQRMADLENEAKYKLAVAQSRRTKVGGEIAVEGMEAADALREAMDAKWLSDSQKDAMTFSFDPKRKEAGDGK